MKLKTAATLFCLVTLWLSAAPARAHKVNFFCEYDDGRVCCRASFGKNAPAKGVKVVVKAKSGRTVGSGPTDAAGKVCFKVSVKPPFKASVDAGAGHLNTFEIEAE